MSFNLGNWWEKLNLDILKDFMNNNNGSDSPVPPDLDLPPGYHAPSWDDPDPYDLTDPAPEPHQDDPNDYFPDPSVPLPGGGEASPDWNDGPGATFTWPWG